MQYKTIVHELLQQHPQLHEQLRQTRRLLPTLQTCAEQLKASHEAWMEQLSQEKPGSQESQIASEAMELALAEFQARLPSGQDETEGLSIDQAMASIKPVTSRD